MNAAMKLAFLILIFFLTSSCSNKDQANDNNSKGKAISYIAHLKAPRFVEMCENSRNLCTTYVAGVVDTNNFISSVTGMPWLCADPNLDDKTDAALNYLKAHPDRSHLGAADLIMEALPATYGQGDNCER